MSLDGGTITGLASNENLLAIDFRPATGDVYLLGATNRLYIFDPNTFEATPFAQLSDRLVGTSFAFDFNPAFMSGEFARIISDTDNNRVVSGETGTYFGSIKKTPVFYDAGATRTKVPTPTSRASPTRTASPAPPARSSTASTRSSACW